MRCSMNHLFPFFLPLWWVYFLQSVICMIIFSEMNKNVLQEIVPVWACDFFLTLNWMTLTNKRPVVKLHRKPPYFLSWVKICIWYMRWGCNVRKPITETTGSHLASKFAVLPVKFGDEDAMKEIRKRKSFCLMEKYFDGEWKYSLFYQDVRHTIQSFRNQWFYHKLFGYNMFSIVFASHILLHGFV